MIIYDPKYSADYPWRVTTSRAMRLFPSLERAMRSCPTHLVEISGMRRYMAALDMEVIEHNDRAMGGKEKEE